MSEEDKKPDIENKEQKDTDEDKKPEQENKEQKKTDEDKKAEKEQKEEKGKAEDNKNDKEKKERKGTDEDLGEVSYTYWKRESDLQADHKGFQPEKVSNPPPENNNQNQQNQIGSAWNKAGTWEEKKVTKSQLESFFNEYIKKNKKEYKNAFFFDEFSNYSGDVR